MARTFILREETTINAPIERCFLLSTSLALVEQTLNMHPVQGGRTSGLVTAGDTVRWKGWKFGLPQSHQSLIEPFDAPNFFRDSMLTGRFHRFQHDHRFLALGSGGTHLNDEVSFSLPMGWLGGQVGQRIMIPHIQSLLTRRFQLLKRIAETEEWRAYLP